MPRNQQIHLDNRPVGEAVASNFKLVVTETPALADGQVLVRHHFLSLDPYMRGRMNDAKSYAQPQALGQTMGGGTVGEIAESRNPKFAVGDKVVGMGGWQEYSVVDANQPGALRKVDTTHVPLSAYLGAVGMPGVTAWYGLVKICQPKAGETMVVSAATGQQAKARVLLERLAAIYPNRLYVELQRHPGPGGALPETEALAERRGAEAIRLAEINELIIRRMRTGVLLVDRANFILRINESAWHLIGNPSPGERELGVVAPELSRRLYEEVLGMKRVTLAEGMLLGDFADLARTGSFIIHSRTHAFALVEGVVHDWDARTSHPRTKIEAAWKVTELARDRKSTRLNSSH